MSGLEVDLGMPKNDPKRDQTSEGSLFFTFYKKIKEK